MRSGRRVQILSDCVTVRAQCAVLSGSDCLDLGGGQL
jgi:hypothetical protein